MKYYWILIERGTGNYIDKGTISAKSEEEAKWKVAKKKGLIEKYEYTWGDDIMIYDTREDMEKAYNRWKELSAGQQQ